MPHVHLKIMIKLLWSYISLVLSEVVVVVGGGCLEKVNIFYTYENDDKMGL